MTPEQSDAPAPPHGYLIGAHAMRMLDIGHTKFNDLIQSGALPAKRFGANTLVAVADIHAFVAALPDARNVKIIPPKKKDRK